MGRVPGVDNPADLGTKSLAEQTIARLLPAAGMDDGGCEVSSLLTLAASSRHPRSHGHIGPSTLAALLTMISQLPVAVSENSQGMCAPYDTSAAVLAVPRTSDVSIMFALTATCLFLAGHSPSE